LQCKDDINFASWFLPFVRFLCLSLSLSLLLLLYLLSSFIASLSLTVFLFCTKSKDSGRLVVPN